MTRGKMTYDTSNTPGKIDPDSLSQSDETATRNVPRSSSKTMTTNTITNVANSYNNLRESNNNNVVHPYDITTVTNTINGSNCTTKISPTNFQKRPNILTGNGLKSSTYTQSRNTAMNRVP